MIDPLSPPKTPEDNGRKWIGVPPWFVGVAGLVLIATFAAVLVLLFRDDGDTIETVNSTTSSNTLESTTSETEPTTTSEATTSTTAETTTASTSTTTGSSTTDPGSSSTVPDEYSTAVWPWVESDVRYGDPVDAARGFAEDFLEFANPIVGEFQQGDSRSGELEIQPKADGPVTTVFVRQLGPDDRWWVLGAATENISANEPAALCEITSPLTISGDALTFEGNVEVQVRADDVMAPLTTTNVTGGGSERMPFTGEVTFASPASGSGSVVFLSRSADDGGVWEAVVVRVSFGPGGC